MSRKPTEPKRVIYYSDAANEDYAGTNIDTKSVDEHFPFIPKNAFFRFFGWIAYYLIAIPLVYFFCFFICGYRVKNKKAVKALKNTGYFLYANHSHFSDAFLSPIVAFPKRAYVIVNPDAVSIPGIRILVQMLGGIPIPQNFKAMPLFLTAVETRAKQGNCVGIFPESHIWNYCTFLRPLHGAAFRYPVAFNLPVIAVALTYQCRKIPFLRSPRRTVFISDPIYPDPTLSKKEAQTKIEREVESFLKEKLETFSDYAYYEYRKQD